MALKEILHFYLALLISLDDNVNLRAQAACLTHKGKLDFSRGISCVVTTKMHIVAHLCFCQNRNPSEQRGSMQHFHKGNDMLNV